MSEKVGIPFIFVANNFSTRETTNWNDHLFIIWQPPEGVILLQDDKVCESYVLDRRRGRSLALSMMSSSSSSINNRQAQQQQPRQPVEIKDYLTLQVFY